MDWKFLFSTFEARVSRQSFWIGHIVLFVVSIIGHVLFLAAFGQGGTAGALTGILTLVLVYPTLAVDVKRLHDRGKSGWWLLLLLVPIVGFIWFIVELGCLPGTAGPNRFGEDPLSARIAA